MLRQLMRYGLMAGTTYLFLLISTYYLVDILTWQETISYLITTTTTYILVYILNTKFVFSSKFTRNNLGRYIVSLVFFWLFNNLLFNFLVQQFGLNYIWAIFINIIFFGLLRFFIQKKFVFQK